MVLSAARQQLIDAELIAYDWLRSAIQQWRTVQAALKEMQRLSRRVLFETLPHPPRRKKLVKEVLGTM